MSRGEKNIRGKNASGTSRRYKSAGYDSSILLVQEKLFCRIFIFLFYMKTRIG